MRRGRFTVPSADYAVYLFKLDFGTSTEADNEL